VLVLVLGSPFFPVGWTPGSIQSMTVLCVKEKRNSSTTDSRPWASTPTLRSMGVITTSEGILGMKCCA
jgi:hypothetical protein